MWSERRSIAHAPKASNFGAGRPAVSEPPSATGGRACVPGAVAGSKGVLAGWQHVRARRIGRTRDGEVRRAIPARAVEACADARSGAGRGAAGALSPGRG